MNSVAFQIGSPSGLLRRRQYAVSVGSYSYVGSSWRHSTALKRVRKELEVFALMRQVTNGKGTFE